MVTLGNGATAQVTADIANLGSNLLIGHAGPACRAGRRLRWRKPFKQRDVELLQRERRRRSAPSPRSSSQA